MRTLGPALAAVAMLVGACGGGEATSEAADAAVPTTAPTTVVTTAPANDATTPVADDGPAEDDVTPDDGEATGSSGGLQSSASPGSGPSEGSSGTSSHSSSQEGIENTEGAGSTEPDEGIEMDVFALAVGDCFNGLDIDVVSEVDGLSCDRPHLYEVYDAFVIDLEAFPGEDGVVDLAAEGCLDRFEPFIGIPYEDSFFEVSYLYPTADSWKYRADREVLCLVINLDETPKTGTARGSEL